ncbi:MAG: hypothetical protein LC745_13350, partial [Planctomycetia bacterium]|nr:hypothetical protein [Planctomycetia bacterium]
GEIRRFLRGLAFAPCYLPETVSYVESHGTATGCEWLEPAEIEAIHGLLARHTGDVESDPADWPAWTDEGIWTTTEPAPADEPFEPSPEDRSWWTTEADRLTTAEEDRAFDLWAAESAATDSLTLGLIPRDLANAISRTSAVGHDS